MSAHLLDRRQFLALSGVALSAQPFLALACRGPIKTPGSGAPQGGPPADIGYGPLQLVNDQTTGLPLLYLPYGFQYLSFGWAGDPLAGGLVTPGRHDGMAAFAGSGSLIRLVRNHEMFSGTAFASQPVYDVNGGGGTTTLEFDTATGAVLDSWASLAGTAVNCAGGLTPWGSWLSARKAFRGRGRVGTTGMNTRTATSSRSCSAPGFLDSGLTVASMLPRPARRSHVAPERGFDSGTSLASTARCTSA